MSKPVLAALAQQLAAYQKLAKLCELQHDCVQHSRTEELLEVLARRQQVLDELAGLEQTLGPAKRRWPQFVAELPAGERAAAESTLAEARRLLEAITAADRNDALVLQQRKLNLGREINQHAAARRVNRSYAAAAYGKRPVGIDVRE